MNLWVARQRKGVDVAPDAVWFFALAGQPPVAPEPTVSMGAQYERRCGDAEMDRLLPFFRSVTSTLAVDEASAQRTVSRLRLVMVLGAIALMGATWRLWTPHTVFPRIPLIKAAASVPDAFEWIGAALLVLSLAVVLLSPESSRRRRLGLLLFSATMTGMIVCDQERLQTWAYQFAILGVVLSLVPPRRAVVLLRLFVASIYFHSALSKISIAFLETTGPTLVYGLLTAFQMTGARQWVVLEHRLEVLLPLTELMVALMLCFPRSRRVGLWVSLGMHLLLMLALGPLGLKHKPGVLIWNAYFFIQNVVLFGPLFARRAAASAPDAGSPISSGSQVARPLQRSASPASRLAGAVAVAAILLPFLEPYGLYDHWPSWAVYAGGTERVSVWVGGATRAKLPETLRQLTTEPGKDDSWCRVQIDRWSLEALAAPIYPEIRFQLGVAHWIATHTDAGEDVLVVLHSRADRWTGEHATRVISGAAEIERELDSFRINGVPRPPREQVQHGDIEKTKTDQ